MKVKMHGKFGKKGGVLSRQYFINFNEYFITQFYPLDKLGYD